MTQDLISSVPGIYTAFLELIQTTAALQTTPVQVFPFEVTLQSPSRYIMLASVEHHIFNWETIGTFSQVEKYDIVGMTRIFTGQSLNNDPGVATSIMSDTYNLFNSCVMTPVMSNRTMPILDTTGPSPYLMLPGYARYEGMPGNIGGSQAGWVGEINWSFHFEAYLTPA